MQQQFTSIKLIKKRCRIKFDTHIPSMYEDTTTTSNTNLNKRRVNSTIKMPQSQLDDYHNLVAKISDKQHDEQDRKFKRAKPKQHIVTQTEVINTLVGNMQNNLEREEKEIFDSYRQSLDFNEREKRKSVFYQDKFHMLMLVQLKERLEQKESATSSKRISFAQASKQLQQIHQAQQLHNQQQQQQQQVIQVEYHTPYKIVLNPRKSISRSQSRGNISTKKNNPFYDQQIQEMCDEIKTKEQRIQNHIDTQLVRLGLRSKQQSPRNTRALMTTSLDKSKSVKTLRHKESMYCSTSILGDHHQNNNQNITNQSQPLMSHKVFDKIKNNIEQKAVDNLMARCDNELAQLNQINTQFNKRFRMQSRKYRGISNELESIAYIGFQNAKLNK